MDEWRVYYDLEPFGQPEQDAQFSYARQTSAVAAGMEKKNKQELTRLDFSLNKQRQDAYDWYVLKRKQKPQQSIDEMKDILMSVASSQKKAQSLNKPRRRK